LTIKSVSSCVTSSQGPIGLVTLFSKKRKHYLTIGYKDAEGFDQVAVIELGKDLVRTTLAVVETRSGKKIEFQDDEARKAGRG
jgi:IS4 transposase